MHIYDITDFEINRNCDSGFQFKSEILIDMCKRSPISCYALRDNACAYCPKTGCHAPCDKNWDYNIALNQCTIPVKMTECSQNSNYDGTLDMCLANATIICMPEAKPDYEVNICYAEQNLCPVGFKYDTANQMCIGTDIRTDCFSRFVYNPDLQLCVDSPRPPFCPSTIEMDGVYQGCKHNARQRPLCLPGSKWNTTIGMCTVAPGYPNCPHGSDYNIKLHQCTRLMMKETKICPVKMELNHVTGLCTAKPLKKVCQGKQKYLPKLNVCVSRRQPQCPIGTVHMKMQKLCTKPINCPDNAKLCAIDNNTCIKHPCRQLIDSDCAENEKSDENPQRRVEFFFIYLLLHLTSSSLCDFVLFFLDNIRFKK